MFQELPPLQKRKAKEAPAKTFWKEARAKVDAQDEARAKAAKKANKVVAKSKQKKVELKDMPTEDLIKEIKAQHRRINKLMKEQPRGSLTVKCYPEDEVKETAKPKERNKATWQMHDWLDSNINTLLAEALAMAMQNTIKPSTCGDKYVSQRYKYEMLTYLLDVARYL